MKKFVSLVLALILALSVFTIVPMSASAEEIDPNKVYVKVNNQHYEVKKGDIFTYTYHVAYEDAKISSLDIRIFYDSKGLKFVPALDENGEEDYTAMFPVLKDTVIANFKIDGQILFNYSKPNGKKLSGDNTTIFCGNFEVTADSGVYEIDGYVQTLADTSMNKIVHKGEVYQEYEEKQDLPELTPIEEETEEPTQEVPTQEPTQPTEPEPTQPTEEPTDVPTDVPTQEPTEIPTAEPTEEPTEIPTAEPTEEPTEIPTTEPTEEPTEIPTTEPTEEPTQIPTTEPTEEPTEIPTAEPTEEPTVEPTEDPTEEPSEVTVYLIDEAGWGFSHVYAWSDKEVHATWPGATMTFVDTDLKGNQIFSFTFKKEYKNIIFNNGAGGLQTEDLDFKAGGMFNNKTMEWETLYGDENKPTELPTDNPTEVPTDPTEPETELPTIKPGDNPGTVFGDVDGDGETKVFDATLIQRYIAKISELTEEQKLIADIDGDGEIKVFDATLLQRYLAKLE